MSEDKTFLQTRTELTQSLVNTLDYDEAVEFAELVWTLKTIGKKMIFVGNGASNTIVNHAALDYMGQTGITTIAVNDPAIITAFSNDFGYENAFKRYCQINYEVGDILVCVSSSGSSPNVVNAANYVKSIGGTVAGFSGFEETNGLANVSDYSFWVDSNLYNVVESIHNLWLAMICDLLIEKMGDDVGAHGINLPE